MEKRSFTAADLDVLRQWDTPTICNGLELIAPERRAIGFTVEQMVAADRKLPPIVGLARTGLIRAKEPPAIVGKGVSRGMDAFESMFAEPAKKANRRR